MITVFSHETGGKVAFECDPLSASGYAKIFGYKQDPILLSGAIISGQLYVTKRQLASHMVGRYTVHVLTVDAANCGLPTYTHELQIQRLRLT